MLSARRTVQRLFYAGLAITLALLLWGWWVGSAHTLGIPGGRLIALGRLFGLLATYTILLEVLLVSRVPYFERNFDLHEIVDLHRWNGYGILLSISAHTLFTVLGYAAPGHTGLWHEFLVMNQRYEDVFKATLGTGIFFVATALSVRAARKRLRYEIWFAAHITLYAAILLVTLHQLKTGGDFVGHFWFTAYWYMWYIGVVGLLAWYRFVRPVVHAWRYEFRVSAVVLEAEDIYSVYVIGRDLERFAFQPGQYATWWVLAPGMWWQAHPFSFSGPPGEPLLRFTAKVSGDFTRRLCDVAPGTRLIIDGPRGSFTAERAEQASTVVLIAGGIGIAPYLAAIETFLESGKHVSLLYAVGKQGEISFRRELAALQKRGVDVRFFVRERGQRIDAAALRPLATPDAMVYVCGPDGMSRSLARLLKQLGIAKQAIVTERFAY